MKKFLFILLVVSSFAFASNPAQVISTASALEGAIEGLCDYTALAYIPGYGVHVSGFWIGDYDLNDYIAQVSAVIPAVGSLVKGLDNGDYISVSMEVEGWTTDAEYLLIRMVNGQPNTLEVWLDGRKR